MGRTNSDGGRLFQQNVERNASPLKAKRENPIGLGPGSNLDLGTGLNRGIVPVRYICKQMETSRCILVLTSHGRQIPVEALVLCSRSMKTGKLTFQKARRWCGKLKQKGTKFGM